MTFQDKTIPSHLPSVVEKNQRLFAYGSNKKGHEHYKESHYTSFLGRGYTYDKYMLVTSPIPFLMEGIKATHIKGEVLEVSPRQLEILDMNFFNGTMTIRKKVPVVYHSLKKNDIVQGDCWVYFGNDLAMYSGLSQDGRGFIEYIEVPLN